MLFSKKNRNKLIGIDIGSSAAKLVELSRSGRSLRVDHYAYEELAPGLIIENQIKDIAEVGAAVQRLLTRSGTKVKRAAVAVSSTNVIAKTIKVQSGMSDDDLDAMVEIEADRVVPYSLDDVNIDYVNLGNIDQSDDEDHIQLVVCRKDVVENIVAVLEEAEVEAAAVDVDHFALTRAKTFTAQADEDTDLARTVAVMDFGYNNTRLLVYNKNRLIYTRENPFGGRQLVDNISQKYGLPLPEAIHALRNNELAESFKAEVLKPYVKTLMQEVLRTLQFFYSSSTNNRIDKLVLTGGCATIGNIDKFLEKRIEIPTVILNPFASMSLGSRVDQDKFRREIPFLGLATGLALRGVE